MKEYILPVKVVDAKGVTNVESLFVRKEMHSVHDSVVANWVNYMKMDGLGSYIILDFGKEMHGGVRLLTGHVYAGNKKIRIRFGESLGEVNSSIGEKNAQNAHSPRDFETYACTSADLSFGQTGFRYVRIDA